MKTSRPHPLPSLVGRLIARVRARPDTEFQQSLIRLAIGVVLFFYFSNKALPLTAEMRDRIDASLYVLFGCGLLITLSALISLRSSPIRRYLSMVLDYGIVSFLLVVTGEIGTPLLVVYLWVTLGYGFRYGPSYLMVAAAMAVAGFSVVLGVSTYWGTHPSISSAFLLSMIAVPLYSVSLLKQLHGAVEREKNANRSKSIFLANMSHELRTPLNGVIGISDLLNETSLNKEQKEYAEIIRNSADTLLELIENVLDISRIEAGRLNIESEDFDLHRLANGTVLMLEHQAKRKELVLAAHIAPQTPFLLCGDARHLRQVMINLIGNAIKFTEHGRVDVYIRPIGQGNPQRLRIEIVDTGIGMTEEAQQRIFDQFTQADTSITRRYGGTGLGTTIAKQLVEMMGGQIGLHSCEGQGTTFWFEIPFALQKAKAGRERATRFEQPMRVGILAGNDLTDRIQGIISSWGAESLIVSNTTQLAAELSSSLAGGVPLAAVVVERSSLRGDPIEFLRLLHDDPSLASLSVILVDSAHAAAPAGETRPDVHFIRGGFASVLNTPLNPTLLFNAIHAAVTRELPQNVISLADRFQSQPGQQRLRILVAEDNPVNQRVIRGLLDHAGFETTLAHDGEEALSLLESDERFDLAIIDMHMPELSGPEVIQRWRFLENGHLPIIMLTADARKDAEQTSEDAGADAFLTKPISGRVLIDMISHLVTHKQQPPMPAITQIGAGSVLDESILDDLAQMGGGHPFVRDLIASFSEDSKRAMTEVQRALLTGDYGLWHDQLHMLKGGASDVGAYRLARKCAEAERIKPFEITASVARNEFAEVRKSLAEAESALVLYQDRKLRAERS